MNEDKIKAYVEEWTGVTLPEKPDPFYQWRMSGDTITFSVSNLTWDFEIAGQQFSEGISLSKHTGVQIHRAVERDGLIIYYRLCSAMKGSDYDAYMVGWATFTTKDTHQDQFKDAASRVSACCRGMMVL